MKLVVFGATGNTGLELLSQGLAAGHQMTAFVRTAEPLALVKSVDGTLAERCRVITGDVLDEVQVTEAIRGHDVVLSCLGTRPWKHFDICSKSTPVIVNAMHTAGIKRLIALSTQGIGALDPTDAPGPLALLR